MQQNILSYDVCTSRDSKRGKILRGFIFCKFQGSNANVWEVAPVLFKLLMASLSFCDMMIHTTCQYMGNGHGQLSNRGQLFSQGGMGETMNNPISALTTTNVSLKMICEVRLRYLLWITVMCAYVDISPNE